MEKLKIKVVIADDHDIFLEGLGGVLRKAGGIELAGSARNGRELVHLANMLQPDVVLTDLNMPVLGGVEAIKQIRASGAATQCIVLSVYDSDQLIIEALEAGAMGYMVKNAAKGEIAEAIHTVYRQRPYYCSSTNTALAKKISASRHNPAPGMAKPVFDEREKGIISRLCREMTSEEIGKELFISKKMVDVIRGRILEKLDVKTTIGIVMYALRHGVMSRGS